MLTFYTTRLPRQKFFLEKNLSSKSSQVKFKNGIHSTPSCFHCFVSSKFRVLVKYFRRSIVILMHIQNKHSCWVIMPEACNNHFLDPGFTKPERSEGLVNQLWGSRKQLLQASGIITQQECLFWTKFNDQ